MQVSTVVHCDTDQFDDDGLKRACTGFSHEDDVWSEDFLEVVIIHSSVKSEVLISISLHDKVVKHSGTNTLLPEGPYVIHSTSGNVYAVYKLFEDTNNAFVRGALFETELSRHGWLQISDYIPVPSRLYYDKPTDDLPLNGLRFGVKDVIDIKGLETGYGSRCYRSFYPPKDRTARCIDQLLSAGAVMVGKMRCCQWCDGQDPLERLEEVTPTNPRGDAFQKPSGSSSGSAAGAASYPWLDFTVGTDTGGSVRHPAGVNGVYGVRPSLCSIERSGMVVACSTFSSSFDTPGIFARSAAVAEAASKAMMDRNWSDRRGTKQKSACNSRRYTLLYAVEPDSAEQTETPKFFSPRQKNPGGKASAGAILEDFVQKLEQHLGCQRREVCIHDLWKETHPLDAPDDLVEATGTIYQNMVYSDMAKNVVHPFVREYQAANEGRVPFIEPSTKKRLDCGADVSTTDCEKSVVALKAFGTWVNRVLLPSPAAESRALDDDDNAIPILVYPQSWGKPRYRDEATKRKEGEIFWSGFSSFSISYCSGCPDFTLPLGEVKFWSRVTQIEEYLPVAISLLGPRGTDWELLELVTELEKVGVLRPVQCGSRLYP